MKLTLAVQCISTWDLTPIEDKTQIFINDIFYSHIIKKGGYRIITKELPATFTLKICVENFLPLEKRLEFLPKDKLVLCELVAIAPQANSLAIEMVAPAYVVLGYNFYHLQENIQQNQNIITIKNPNRDCIEGRRFLLRDTKSGAEEFVIIGDALNVLLTTYKTPITKNSYNAESSVLLPAFCADCLRVPVRKPPAGGVIWVYENNIKRKLEWE